VDSILPDSTENIPEKDIFQMTWKRRFDGDCILPNLYLGSASSLRSKDVLQEYKITHVLTVSDEFPPNYTDDIHYLVVPVSDEENSNLIEVFEECSSFIDEGRQQGAVYVHCAAGISRSPTVVVAYLLLRAIAPTPAEALELVRKQRTVVFPNTGFWKQLVAFHKANFDLKHQVVTSMLSNLNPKPILERFNPQYFRTLQLFDEKVSEENSKDPK